MTGKYGTSLDVQEFTTACYGRRRFVICDTLVVDGTDHGI